MKKITDEDFMILLKYAMPRGVKSENIHGGPRYNDNMNIISDWKQESSLTRAKEHLAYMNLRGVLMRLANDKEIDKYID